MWITAELILLFASIGVAYKLGKMELARFVWNLLANDRSAAMAEAVCLYCAMENSDILSKNGWKTANDVYRALRDKKELVDDI